jgi:hypothetical protein
MFAKEAFETYPLEKLSMTFVQNKQVAWGNFGGQGWH